MTGDIIDRIDAAVGCQRCQGPLGDSPSSDFCSEDCQTEWGHSRVGAVLPEAGGIMQNIVGTLESLGVRVLPWQQAPVADFAITRDGGIVALSARAREMRRGR